MSKEDLYATFHSVTQQDLIDYLPQLEFTEKNTAPVWYTLMHKNEIIKRIKAHSLTAAFKKLATVKFGHSYTSPIDYYYSAMLTNLDTVDQILCYKDMSQAEFFEMYKMDHNFVKKTLLEWMIDECNENDIVHIEHEDFTNSTWDATKIITEPIDVNNIIKDSYDSPVIEKPPSFDEFVAEVKRRAVQKVNEYYRIINDAQIQLAISEDIIFRGNIWQVLLDLETMCFKAVLNHLYDYTIDLDDEILDIDELMGAVEEHVREDIVLNIRQLTIFKAKNRRRIRRNQN